jgi:hypothetical protein
MIRTAAGTSLIVLVFALRMVLLSAHLSLTRLIVSTNLVNAEQLASDDTELVHSICVARSQQYWTDPLNMCPPATAVGCWWRGSYTAQPTLQPLPQLGAAVIYYRARWTVSGPRAGNCPIGPRQRQIQVTCIPVLLAHQYSGRRSGCRWCCCFSWRFAVTAHSCFTAAGQRAKK